MTDPVTPLNLNTASRAELLTLSGINSTLADRIVEARPFANPEDLQQVKGISQRLYKRLAPFVTVLQTEAPAMLPAADQPGLVQADAAVEEVVKMEEAALPVIEPSIPESEVQPEALPPIIEPSIPESEGQPEALPPVIEPDAPYTEPSPAVTKSAPLPPPSGNRPAPAYVTRGQAFWMAIGSAVLSSLLAFGGVLLLLGLLNGGLRFASPADIEQLASQVETLDTGASDLKTTLDTLNTNLGTISTEVDTLNANMATLDTRLEALDGPNGQMTQLGETVADVATSMETWELQLDAVNLTVDDLASQVAGLNTQAETLSLQVDALLTRTGRFQAFIDGLTSLLGTIMIPEDAPVSTSTPETPPPNWLPYPAP